MKETITYQSPDTQGYYGQFGGAYIPEMLHRNGTSARRFEDVLRAFAGQEQAVTSVDGQRLPQAQSNAHIDLMAKRVRLVRW